MYVLDVADALQACKRELTTLAPCAADNLAYLRNPTWWAGISTCELLKELCILLGGLTAALISQWLSARVSFSVIELHPLRNELMALGLVARSLQLLCLHCEHHPGSSRR